jgi:hypothetical protein
MNSKSQFNLLSRRSLNLGIAFVVVVLVAGIYFLFRPFPAGPSLDVKAEVPEAASIAGWSAVANPPAIEQAQEARQASSSASSAASVQRLDIGAGYVLETDQQGSRIVAPSVPSVSSSAVERLDIGSGYVLELNQAGGQIIGPANPAAAASAAQAGSIPSSVRQIIGSDVGRNSAPASVAEPAAAQEPGLIPSSVRQIIGSDVGRNVAPAFSSQRLDLGAGYVLETDAQGSKIVAPTTLLKGGAVTPAAGFPTRIALGGGYTLVLDPDGQGEIVKGP